MAAILDSHWMNQYNYGSMHGSFHKCRIRVQHNYNLCPSWHVYISRASGHHQQLTQKHFYWLHFVKWISRRHYLKALPKDAILGPSTVIRHGDDDAA